MPRHALQFTRLAAFALMIAFVAMGTARANDLVGMLTSQLGVSDEQATGGAGSILDYAKGQMAPGEFDVVSQSMPDLGSLVGSSMLGGSGGGTSSLMQSGSSLLGGSSGDLGGAAQLASSFSDLGMSTDMVGQFVPVILDYAKTNGSEQALQLLQGALTGL